MKAAKCVLSLIAIVIAILAGASGDTAANVGERPVCEEREAYDLAEAFYRPPAGILVCIRGPEEGVPRKTLTRLDASGKRWVARIRSSYGDCADRTAFYGRIGLMRSRCTFHYGWFMPDLAGGMIFAGYENSYPFSGRYPLRYQKLVAPRVSFYGNSIEGGAVTARYGRMNFMIFRGRPGRWSGERLIREKDPIDGIRVDGAFGGVAAGATFARWGSAGCRSIVGIDASIDRGGLFLSSESSVDEHGRASLSMGVEGVSGKGRISMMLVSSSSGSRSGFGRIPLFEPGADPVLRVVSVNLRRKMRRGASAGISMERGISVDEERSVEKSRFRGELKLKGRVQELKLSVTASTRSSMRLTPYPPGMPTAGYRSDGVNILYRAGTPRRGRVRISLRAPRGDGYAGFLLSQSLRKDFCHGAAGMELFVAAYGSTRGRAVFYYYEPSDALAYPWRRASGDGSATVFITRCNILRCRLIGILALEDGRRGSLDIQIGYRF